MVNAKYKSKIDLILPIKLSNVMSLNLKNLGCLEFKLEHVEKQEFLGRNSLIIGQAKFQPLLLFFFYTCRLV